MEGEGEGARLEAKTDTEAVRARLELVGLGEGARALDAGAGTGAVARAMAELVGAGEVVAFDASRERLALGRKIARERGAKNLRFVQGDLYRPPFPAGSFDFVWSEFVFEYLADPDAALAQLAALVRPGGKLVIADLDGNGIFHEPMPPDLAAALDRLLRGIAGSFDAHAGRRLYTRFHRAGLTPARVHLLPYHLYAGAISDGERANWRRKLDGLRARGEPALGGAEAYGRFVETFLRVLDDPASLTYSVLFLVEWTRPR